jgi:hypothetical protein
MRGIRGPGSALNSVGDGGVPCVVVDYFSGISGWLTR